MKKLIMVICAVSSFLIAQDAAGDYKLTGLDVQYYMAARYETPVYVYNDLTGPVELLRLQPGELFYEVRNGPLSEGMLNGIGVALNVELNTDGTGALLEGSSYPDQEMVVDENGDDTCVSEILVLPITDELEYTSWGDLGEYTGFAHPGVNVIGIPSISQYAGEYFGGLGLSQSVVFDYFPMTPDQPSLCDGAGNCFPLCYPDGSLPPYVEDGACDPYPAGAPMQGVQAGFFWKEGLNGPADIQSIIPGNTDPDFYLEWHAIDGAAAESGLGDYIGEDEDGDGTDFDRVLGVPALSITNTNPACGLNFPIYGGYDDIAPYLPAGCATGGDVGIEAYIMDASFAEFGGFLTFNAAYHIYMSGPNLGNDGDHDYDGVSGRLTFTFDPTCVPEVEIREVVAEFIEVGTGNCELLGDMTGANDGGPDGQLNVQDILALVNCILGADTGSGCAWNNGGSEHSDCAGDLTGDGSYNVFDILALVNAILGRVAVEGATSAEFIVSDNEVTMTANGYVGAVEITLTHGNGFQIDLTDDAMIAEYLTTGNTTHLIIVEPTGNSLFTTDDDFIIESLIAASNSENYMQTSVNMLKDYRIGSAYPNPFNPSTQVMLDLYSDANVSVKVFNTMGQLIDVIADGQMAKGGYSFTWNGTNVASGIYLIKTDIGGDTHSQKVMLIK